MQNFNHKTFVESPGPFLEKNCKMPYSGSNVLKINLQAIRTNYQLLTEAYSCRIMPMVKASAYGTDAISVTRCLQECGAALFGVSHVSEGVFLRESGIFSSIFVLNAPIYEHEAVIHYDLEPAISSLEEARHLSRLSFESGKQIRIHVHVNTGMQRLGADPALACELVKHIHALPGLQLMGIFSHFVASESAQHDPFSMQQIEIFKNAVFSLHKPPPLIHFSNSAALLRFPLSFCNMARIGLLLYGILPYGAPKQRFIPALSLFSRLSGINACKKGDTVGYKRTFAIEREKAVIGVVPLGYHDGIRQFFSKGGHVLIRQKPAPILGRICMDFFMVDITEIPEARIGDSVELFGEGLPIQTVAAWGEMNVRELMAGLGPRIKREVTDHG